MRAPECGWHAVRVGSAHPARGGRRGGRAAARCRPQHDRPLSPPGGEGWGEGATGAMPEQPPPPPPPPPPRRGGGGGGGGGRNWGDAGAAPLTLPSPPTGGRGFFLGGGRGSNGSCS